jgi:predicted dehydrogenase
MRIGMLGVAHVHVASYLAAVQAAGASVVGVYDWDIERGQAWANSHDISFAGHPEALLDSRLDGVIVCAETVFHEELIKLAVQARVAVLCEKPLGVSREDLISIVNSCSSAGVPLMTCFPARFHPAVRLVRSMVIEGDLGRVRALIGTNQGVMPILGGSWFTDRQFAGGGAMMDHIVHLADIFCWMSGATPKTVYAISNRVVHAEVVTVETGGLVVMNYPDEMFASIDCSWDRPLSYPTWGDGGFTIVGETGTVEVDLTSERLTQFGGDRDFSWVPWGADTNQLMIEEFLAAIREGREPAVTGVEGQVATEIALGALESAATGEVVELTMPFTRRAG